MPKRVEIDDDLHALAEQNCPKYLSVTGFINLIIDQSLDRVSRLPTCRAGAGNTFNVSRQPSPQSPLNEAGLNGPDFQASGEAVPSKKKNSPETLSLTPPLEKFDELIREFFRLKKGSKSKTAWSHLMTGLTKIQDKYGDTVVEEQLMAAINGRWSGITLKNYEEFGKPKPKPAWQQEPEMKHPAHRDFTAERLAAERAQREEEEKHNFLGF